ncbi:hypothetical protein LTR86_002500 [Recurvomyces mirabilis]|nr:hypothetical protein LTR86_002500 [Recurvomyces mirabilis]
MTSYLPNLARDNISFYLIPAAWTIALLPRAFAAKTYSDCGKAYNNLQPRDFTNDVHSDQALDKKTRGRIVRAEAAQANSFENLPLFAAAVVAGNAAGLDVATLNYCALAYVTSRFAYNHIYIFQDLVPAPVRTVAWFAGVCSCFTLFIQAGWKYNSRTIL